MYAIEGIIQAGLVILCCDLGVEIPNQIYED